MDGSGAVDFDELHDQLRKELEPDYQRHDAATKIASFHRGKSTRRSLALQTTVRDALAPSAS